MRFRPQARLQVRLALSAGMLLTAFSGLASPGTLIERTVAFVNKKPVLLSDVALSQALLNLTEPEAIERAIDEALMFEEASRLLNEPHPEEAISAAVLDLKEKAGPAFSATALRRKALVQLAISGYIERRLKSLVRVEDAEVRALFNELIARDPLAPPFSAVASGIRLSLEARSLDQKVEEWVASLRIAADIRRPAR